jgi:transcriptional regulator with XRE-family HTH domain
MTLGEKIKELRTKNGITQEKLAEQLNVSRSAIAKWESNGGTPEIGNLKLISEIFSVSIDSLIDETSQVKEVIIKESDCQVDSYYTGKICDIELIGWNDGVYDVVILSEDENFFLYQHSIKKGEKRGLIGKKYIENMKISKLTPTYELELMKFDRDIFCNRPVLIEIANREGLIKGFFDLRNDDYLNVVIKSFTDRKIELAYGREIDILDICKIEEIDT